ncbi:hypothetical protein [Hyphomicrobium sp.]|uniref:hypothetical protein n=1 Tax=Hyphomicrobium sp. TaxID=82 RepID=UPI002E31D991|nr:hypothetical protein [Hyphomicrobium sp.]HEX2841433.1 hypothetical protein [Hyphomicrobium sp.]
MSEVLCTKTLKVLTIAAVVTSMLTVEAAAYSKKVENACRGDYDTHCPGYKVGSAALHNCIELAGKRGNLSKGCFDALVDAGMVPRKYLKKKYP